MREVGAFEAKTKLGELLAAVEAGEEVRITRRGRPVARLVPDRGDGGRREALAALDAMRARLAGRMSRTEILSARDEGRR